MDIHLINQRLRDQFGTDVASDKPVYRVVWSDDELENRTGLFQDFVSGTNILIRSVHETRQVKKYNYIKPPQYVLEQLMPNQHLEINAKLSYEPVWIFDKREIIYRALELLIHTIRNPRKPMNEKQLASLEQEQIIEDERLMDELLQSQMKFDKNYSAWLDGDLIILDKTDMWRK